MCMRGSEPPQNAWLTVTDDASATMQGRVITMVGEGTWADRFEQLASALSHVSSAVTP